MNNFSGKRGKNGGFTYSSQAEVFLDELLKALLILRNPNSDTCGEALFKSRLKNGLVVLFVFAVVVDEAI